MRTRRNERQRFGVAKSISGVHGQGPGTNAKADASNAELACVTLFAEDVAVVLGHRHRFQHLLAQT